MQYVGTAETGSLATPRATTHHPDSVAVAVLSASHTQRIGLRQAVTETGGVVTVETSSWQSLLYRQPLATLLICTPDALDGLVLVRERLTVSILVYVPGGMLLEHPVDPDIYVYYEASGQLRDALWQAARYQPAPANTPQPILSPRAQRILRLTAEGFSTDHIATALDISPRRVRQERVSIYRALGVQSLAACTLRASALLGVREG